MILDQCPHCLVKHVQTANTYNDQLKLKDGRVLWKVERCQNVECGRLVLIEIANTGEIQQTFPFAAYTLNPDTPLTPEIREDFDEAGRSLGAGCYKASLVMSRRVLQRCLEEQGCNERNLVDAINFAVQNNILRKAFHALADEIRQYGNLGAHPDDDQLQNANKKNAEQVLEFARLLIHDFYEVPATAAQLKKNRKQ